MGTDHGRRRTRRESGDAQLVHCWSPLGRGIDSTPEDEALALLLAAAPVTTWPRMRDRSAPSDIPAARDCRTGPPRRSQARLLGVWRRWCELAFSKESSGRGGLGQARAADQHPRRHIPSQDPPERAWEDVAGLHAPRGTGRRGRESALRVPFSCQAAAGDGMGTRVGFPRPRRLHASSSAHRSTVKPTSGTSGRRSGWTADAIWSTEQEKVVAMAADALVRSERRGRHLGGQCRQHAGGPLRPFPAYGQGERGSALGHRPRPDPGAHKPLAFPHPSTSTPHPPPGTPPPARPRTQQQHPERTYQR